MINFYIIIPIYNVESYIKESLDSLKMQTYSNFKAILVNDGSSDKSGEIAQDYCKNDTRFIYISQDNQGVASARNVALDYIFNIPLSKMRGGQSEQNSTTYIAFLDPDDYLEINALSHIAEILSNNKVDTFISNRSYCIIDNNRQISSYTTLKKHLENRTFTTQELISIAPDSKLTTTWAFIFRDAVLKTLRFECITNGSDVPFCTFATLKSQSIYIDSMPIYNYRIRQNSLMRSNNHAKKANSHFKIADIFYAKLQNETDKNLIKFYYYNIKQATKQLLLCLKNCDSTNLAFSKKDLAKLMSFVGIKYRLHYYFPKFFGLNLR